MTTLTNLRTKVRNRLGRPDTDAFLTDAKLTAYINEALSVYSAEGDWAWLEASETLNTSSGVATVTPDASSRGTIGLFDPTGVPVKRLPLDELMVMGTGQAGITRFFGNVGPVIHLRPVPNATIALTHIYLDTETVLSSDSDAPLLPTAWDPVVVNYACYLATLAEGNENEALAYHKGYEGWLGRLPRVGDRLEGSTGGGVDAA